MDGFLPRKSQEGRGEGKRGDFGDIVGEKAELSVQLEFLGRKRRENGKGGGRTVRYYREDPFKKSAASITWNEQAHQEVWKKGREMVIKKRGKSSPTMEERTGDCPPKCAA